MLPLNDEWLSWPPESLESFLIGMPSTDAVSQQTVPTEQESVSYFEEISDETDE